MSDDNKLEAARSADVTGAVKRPFYGYEDAKRVAPVSPGYAALPDAAALYGALLSCWSAATAAPRMRDRWSESDPTVGQCSVTAFLAQDIFGGKVFGVPLGDGNFHCFNVVGDRVFDLTSAQFGARKLDYSQNFEQSRETHFAKEEKRLRYELLRSSLRRLLGVENMEEI